MWVADIGAHVLVSAIEVGSHGLRSKLINALVALTS